MSSRLLLDGIIFGLQRHGGVTVYFRELLKRMRPEHRATLLLDEPLKQPLSAADLPAVERVERMARAVERYRDCRLLPASVDGPAVFHSSYYRQPIQRQIPTVVTVHDFAYERCVGGLKTRVHAWQKYGAIRQAQAIICISEATRDDLLEFVGVRSDQHLYVIHNGVSEHFCPMEQEMPDTPHFALFVGQRGRYKNFSLALAALDQLPELELHCVGGGPLQDSEFARAAPSVRARVRHLGAVDDARLNQLYNTAQCLIYPSAYEGFGIPVLEAMRAGCPVVGIACKAVIEVGGPSLLVAEQPTGPALAEAIRRATGSERATLRQQGLARARGFSWDRCFAETSMIYRALGAAEPSRSPRLQT